MTTITKRCFGCTDSSTTIAYDSLGNTASVKDANGNLTSFDYTDAGTGQSGTPIRAFVTKVTAPTTSNGIQHIRTFSFDYTASLMTTSSDESGNITTYTYNDPLRRLTNITGPALDNGQHASTDYRYTDTVGSISMTKTVAASPDPDIVSVLRYDGYGNLTSDEVDSAPYASVTAHVTDGFMHPAKVSNPYFSNVGATEWTTQSYDALGRLRSITNPDSSTRTNAYSVNQVSLTDEAQHTWVQSYDSLGRLSSVVEDAGSAPKTTNYTYDALGDLLTVSQQGMSGDTPRSRSFTYDSLSRLLTTNNPESGNVCYGTWNNWTVGSYPCSNGYDANGNLLLKTDARGQVVNYSYDALNRMTQKWSFGSYTPWSMKTWTYDVAPSGWGGVTVTNATGRLAFVSDLNTSSDPNKPQQVKFYSYDTMGRLKVLSDLLPQEIGASPPPTALGYDLAGNTIDLTYPDGRQVGSHYNSAGQVDHVFAGTTQSPGQDYVSSISYFPNASPQTVIYGNGVVVTHGINSRLQPCTDLVTGNGSTYLNRAYRYAQNPSGSDCGGESANNGNIWHLYDHLPGSLYSQDFHYDSLNRINYWQAPDMAGAYRTANYSYDSFGNLANAMTAPGAIPSTFSADNRVSNLGCSGLSSSPPSSSSPSYDSSGNILCSGSGMSVYGYEWGQLGELAEVWQYQNDNNFTNGLKARYFYDESGNRIRAEQYSGGNTTTPVSTRDYAYLNGQVLGEIDNNNAWTDYIYAGGKKIAQADPLDHRIRLSGHQVNAYEGGVGYNAPANLYVQSGDRICWQQYNSNAVGGVTFQFDNGNPAWELAASDGQQINQDYNEGGWQNRCVGVPSQYVGHEMQLVEISHDINSPNGDWAMLIADLMYLRPDGSVIPLFGAGLVPFTSDTSAISDGSGGTEWRVIEDVPVASDSYVGTTALRRVHYNVTDQVGTTQLDLSAGGYPTWRGQFGPFGQEFDAATTTDRYKFTGKERDTESGLDYFGARYYASSMGRWMSPDWSPVPIAVPYANLGDPQSLNLYQYVRNNPLGQADVDGHHWWNKLGNLFTDSQCWCEGAEAAKQAQQNRQNWAAQDLARQRALQDPFLKTLISVTQTIALGQAAGAISEMGFDPVSEPTTITEETWDFPEVVVDSSKYPESAQHITDAQEAGQPSVVTIDRAGAASRRGAALKNVQGSTGMDRDEYPPAFAREGGSGASTRVIPRSDNRGSGAAMGNQIRNLPDGSKVKITTK